MLDDDLLREGDFPSDQMKVIKNAIMRGAQGNEIQVLTSELDVMMIGKHRLSHVPVQLLMGRKPVKGKNIHILGNEVLKRFNTFLDFQEQVICIKPNHLYFEAYIDRAN